MSCSDHDVIQEDNRLSGDCEEIETINKLGMVDVIIGKAVSRKLLVFATATALLMWYGLDPDTWGLIAMIYVGGQSVIDTVKVWKHGG